MSKHTEQALESIRRFWRRQQPGPLLSVYTEPGYRQNPDEDALVAGAVKNIRAEIAAGEANVLPTFLPDFGTVSMPALWGGRRIPASSGGGIHIEPIAHALDDLKTLPEPVPYEKSDFARAVGLYRRVCAELPGEDIFIRTPDFQGPMNTLGLLMDQTELLVSLFEEPELIHRVLTHITDVSIDYIRRYREEIGPEKVVGNLWPWIVLPDGIGVGITQDFMPLLGPDLYEQFELPQLKRIADAFGGVFIHCCGEYAQHLPALARARERFKIFGIETHHPCTRLPAVHAALGDDLAYTPYIAPTGQAEYPSMVNYLIALGDDHRDRLYVAIAKEWMSAPELDRLRRWAAR